MKHLNLLIALAAVIQVSASAEREYIALNDVYMVRINQTSIDNKVFPVTIYGYQSNRFNRPPFGNSNPSKLVALAISGGQEAILNRCLALAQNMMSDRLLVEHATSTQTPKQTLRFEIGGSIAVDNRGNPLGKRVETEHSIFISNFVVSGCVVSRGEGTELRR